MTFNTWLIGLWDVISLFQTFSSFRPGRATESGLIINTSLSISPGSLTAGPWKMMVGASCCAQALLAAPPTDAGEDQASWTMQTWRLSFKSLHMIVLKTYSEFLLSLFSLSLDAHTNLLLIEQIWISVNRYSRSLASFFRSVARNFRWSWPRLSFGGFISC